MPFAHLIIVLHFLKKRRYRSVGITAAVRHGITGMFDDSEVSCNEDEDLQKVCPVKSVWYDSVAFT